MILLLILNNTVKYIARQDNRMSQNDIIQLLRLAYGRKHENTILGISREVWYVGPYVQRIFDMALSPSVDDPATAKTIETLKQAFNTSQAHVEPYQYFEYQAIFPDDVLTGLQSVELPHFQYDQGYGARNIYNKYRHYFNQINNQRYPSFASVAQAFQSSEIISSIESCFKVDLSGLSLRIEFTQDTDGFWLQPHTDIGAKKFTMLIYLSDGPGHEHLGTDIYAAPGQHVRACPAKPNAAMAFIPTDHTWHGFEKRPINGVRKTAIVNYVTADWQQRDELAFPAHPVKSAPDETRV